MTSLLYAAPAVRDRGWWLRTGAYWFVLGSQLAETTAGPERPLWQVVALVVMSLACAVAVWFRDERPWALAGLALVTGAAFAPTPIATGVVAVAGRGRWWVTVGYAGLAAAALAAPWTQLQ